MNEWQEQRAKEFADFYGWPLVDVQALFGTSKSFFECVWRGMNPRTRAEEEAYYNGPWLTLRQMSYTREEVLPSSITDFIDAMTPGEALLDFGCGVGDCLIYAAARGVHAVGVEVPGKQAFLVYRHSLHAGPWRAYDHLPDGRFDRALLISSLDHVPDPVATAKTIALITRGPIYATPCIDETYDRPTHAKYILKHVPEAFEVIREHNKHFSAS